MLFFVLRVALVFLSCDFSKIYFAETLQPLPKKNHPTVQCAVLELADMVKMWIYFAKLFYLIPRLIICPYLLFPEKI